MPVNRLLMATSTTPDLAAAASGWTKAAHYERVVAEAVSPELCQLWGIQPETSIAMVVTRAPGTDSGYLRLVRAEPRGVRKKMLETLGPFGFELFARDVDAVHKEMTSDGAFVPQTPPTDFDLSGIGSGLCRSFAAKGPGNVWVLITTMLSVPPPRALPITHHFVGPVVTMPIAALNRAVAVEFYAGVLGIPIRFDGSVRDRDVNRIMGAGDDWQMHITVFFIEDGQLVEHHFHTPGDLMETPVNPGSLLNGPAIYTFTVTDIDAIVAAARDRQIQVRGPIVLDAFPYSRRRVACLDGPNHEIVEIVAAELG